LNGVFSFAIQFAPTVSIFDIRKDMKPHFALTSCARGRLFRMLRDYFGTLFSLVFSQQGHQARRTKLANQQNQGGGRQGGTPGQQTQKPAQGGQQGGSKENNPGNFANDPEKASEAGRKGGQS
jgi:uncharacterized protein